MLVPRSGSVEIDGRDIAPLSERELRPVRREAQIVFQDPYESLDPRYRVRDTVAEPLVIHRIGYARGAHRARARGARARGPLPGRAVPRPLPARALGRPAAARRDRGRARAGAEAARRRRARLDARRLRARRHPRPARRAAARRARDPDDHARPLDRHAVRRPDHGHVPRPHRRGRACAHRRRQSAAPVHARADLGRAAPRPARPAPAADPAGRDAEPGRHPGRLPLPPPLPDRRRRLPRRRPAARAARAAIAPPASSFDRPARRLAAALAARAPADGRAAAARARDRRAQPPRPLARAVGRLARRSTRPISCAGRSGPGRSRTSAS